MVLVVFRIHGQNSSLLPAIECVRDALVSSLLYATHILVCIDAEPSYIAQLSEIAATYIDKISIQCINPWGKFTFALNVALKYAVDNIYPLIMFQSLEVRVGADKVARLMNSFKDGNVCVVGSVVEGHEFTQGQVQLRGRTCPWNTLAIWRVEYLQLLGFLAIGDGTADVEGGVEEVSTLALLLHIKPALKAILVRDTTAEVTWNTQFDDPVRQMYHEKKMKSKDERPARHLEILGIPEQTVFHVEL